MKRISIMKNVIISILFLSLLFLSCSVEKKNEQGSDTLSKILKEGKIRVGYFVEPPAVMIEPNSREVYGTSVEAIKYIASQLKVKVEFTEVDLGKFAAGLQNNSYDVSIGSTFKTIPRAASCAFTRTLYYLGYTAVVIKGKAKLFQNESDIDKPGVIVAVKEGSAIHRYVQDNFKKAKILVLAGTDLSIPLQAVSSGNATVGFMNEHTVEYFAKNHSEVEIILKSKPIQICGMSWAVRPNDIILLNFLNTSLEFLESSGMLAEWEKQYYGSQLRHLIPTN